MKIRIKNLGAIKEAEIDLSKRFYFLFGYNNTGKTYLSKMLFLLFRAETFREFLSSKEAQDLPIVFSDENSFEITADFSENLLKSFFEFFKKKIDYAPQVEIQITEYNMDEFTKQKKHDRVGVFVNNVLRTPVTMLKPPSSNVITLTYKDIIKNDDDEDRTKKEFSKQSLTERAAGRIKRMILTSLLGNIDNYDACYFPADRVFYLKNYDWILYRQAQTLEEIRKRLTRKDRGDAMQDIIIMAQKNYTNVEDILLEQLHNLGEQLKREKIEIKDTYSTINQKFTQIIEGDILPEITNIETIKALSWKYNFKDKDNDITIPLSQASSMVNQLASLGLYWKYMARGRQDFLFIDEPEENLHPKAQIKLLDLLVEFSAMHQNRVLIASHSPLMADALNNYIYWTEILEKSTENDDLQKPQALPANMQGLTAKDFVVYAFETNGKIQTYSFEELGVYFKSFEKEQRNIQHIQQDLMEIDNLLKEKV